MRMVEGVWVHTTNDSSTGTTMALLHIIKERKKERSGKREERGGKREEGRGKREERREKREERIENRE